ncbi:MAG TPA: hypothetical protein ENN09_01390 [Planctomycetes bacterium]|nr:hypothetical protein [Planctomycetota bacterium]
MQVIEKKWSWKDAPSAISMALSPTRLLTGMAGILVIEILAWGMGKVWPPAMLDMTLMGGLRMLVLGAVVLYVLYVTVSVIGRSVYLELEEGEGLGIGGSISFLVKTAVRTGLAPLVFLAIMALMWGLASALFTLGRLWSVIGAVLYLPLMILVIFAGMAAIVAVFGLYVATGSAGVRKSGMLDTVLDTVDMVRGRGVFWGFVITLMGVMLLGVFITFFHALGIWAILVGMGSAPPVAANLNVVSVGWVLGLLKGVGIAETASGVTDWIWVIALKVFQLASNSFLLGAFAGSGVFGYLVGSEDEIVVVEERRIDKGQEAAPPVPKVKEEHPAAAEKPAEKQKEAEKEEKGKGEVKEKPEDAAGAAEGDEKKRATTRKHAAVKRRQRRKTEDEK